MPKIDLILFKFHMKAKGKCQGTLIYSFSTVTNESFPFILVLQKQPEKISTKQANIIDPRAV